MTITADVRAVMLRDDAIPPMPRIVTRLFEITADPDYRIEDVISLLSTDPAVAADILRLANSPLFGVSRKVGSLTHAANLLGIKRIKTLVTGRCMVDSVTTRGAGSIDVTCYWRRSLATAVLSARLAEQLVPRLREEAFTGGLLSDVGVVVLARAIPDDYAPIVERYAVLESAYLLDIERQAVGVTHPEISAAVLERWSLPEIMIQGVRHHHDRQKPADLPDGALKLASIIDCASAVGRILCEPPEKGVIAKTCLDAVDAVGLDLRTLEPVLRAMESDVNEFAAMLRIDVIPVQAYALISDALAELPADSAECNHSDAPEIPSTGRKPGGTPTLVQATTTP